VRLLRTQQDDLEAVNDGNGRQGSPLVYSIGIEIIFTILHLPTTFGSLEGMLVLS